MQSEYGLRPDFVFVTGDLAFGRVSNDGMMDQYQLVRDFFDCVRKAFDPEIDIRDLYVVPGNHDVDREEVTEDQTAWLRSRDRSVEQIISIMQDRKKQWRQWMERLDAYRNFINSYGLAHLSPEDPHLVWGDARDVHGFRVGLGGFNSAWSCVDNEDKSKIWLGADWQIATVKQRIGPVDFSFALIHHPGNWFRAEEDPIAMRRLRGDFEIVLHGHEHQNWVDVSQDGRLVLSAGACYEASWMDNGYAFGQIDLESRTGATHLRQWESSGGGGWVARNIYGKTIDGCYPLGTLPWLGLPVQSSSIPEGSDIHCAPPDSLERQNEHYTRRFCENVVDRFDVLELFGCDIPRELQRHQLSIAYVSLNLGTGDASIAESCNGKAEHSEWGQAKIPFDKEEERDCEAQNFDDGRSFEAVLDGLSNDGGRLLINGPAGAGKSTLLRWCAVTAATTVAAMMHKSDGTLEATSLDPVHANADALARSLDGGWRNKTPFLIRLRDCSSGSLPAAEDFPKFLAKHLPAAPDGWVVDMFEAGQALILLDGVDEIHRDQRPLLAEEIRDLVHAYPDCTYVITTRPGAVPEGWLDREGFVDAYVEPMSKRDREEFVTKWFRSAALELQKRPRPGEDLRQTAMKLNAELVEQPELGVLATNPLLCAMICALYRERQEKLPESPAELAEALCNMLLHRRERETPGLGHKHFSNAWRELQYGQKKALLAEIAWCMVRKGESSIETADVVRIVKGALTSIPGRNEAEAEEVVQALVERSGLLRPAREESIDFLHNTLKEYLAASHICESADWSVLAQHADDPSWQPVILFALASANEAFSSGLVAELLRKMGAELLLPKRAGSLNKEEKTLLAEAKARQFFLVRCRSAAKRLASELSAKIDGFLAELLPPQAMNEIEALSLLGPKILAYGEATIGKPSWWANQNSQVAARCLRLMRTVGGARASSYLRSIRTLNASSSLAMSEWLIAVNELCEGEHVDWPFKQANSLFLSSSMLQDIRPLRYLTHLKFLSIERSSVVDLSPLSEIETLEWLSASRTMVADIRPLVSLRSLRSLYLGATNIVDAAPLAELSELESLSLSNTPISDFSPISKLEKLNRLDLSGTRIRSLEVLSALHELRALGLNFTEVEDLLPIAKLSKLEDLNMMRANLSDISPLRHLVALKRLDLDGTQVGSCESLLGLHQMEWLDLSKTKINDIYPLHKMKSLTFLRLTDAPVSCIKPLAECTSLDMLDLSGTKVSDVSPLSGLKMLRSLSLRNLPVESLEPLEKLPSLLLLSVRRGRIDEREIERFKKAAPHVRVV